MSISVKQFIRCIVNHKVIINFTCNSPNPTLMCYCKSEKVYIGIFDSSRLYFTGDGETYSLVVNTNDISTIEANENNTVFSLMSENSDVKMRVEVVGNE